MPLSGLGDVDPTRRDVIGTVNKRMMPQGYLMIAAGVLVCLIANYQTSGLLQTLAKQQMTGMAAVLDAAMQSPAPPSGGLIDLN